MNRDLYLEDAIKYCRDNNIPLAFPLCGECPICGEDIVTEEVMFKDKYPTHCPKCNLDFYN